MVSFSCKKFLAHVVAGNSAGHMPAPAHGRGLRLALSGNFSLLIFIGPAAIFTSVYGVFTGDDLIAIILKPHRYPQVPAGTGGGFRVKSLFLQFELMFYIFVLNSVQYLFLNSLLSSLPVGVIGIDSVKSTDFGHL